ncbi:MAG: hypothetical protein KatS3mg001_344 [Candidatus Pacearchaeota archaeon]|nr:MAG: hypothetical protein KatS3mg001_344 [Candidatus Pacearchaeota archaeon]
MKILGFNFTKVNAERLKEVSGKITINTEIDFPNFKELKQDFLKTKEPILEASFSYKVKYEPEFAIVVIDGKILFSVDEKLAKETLKGWKKKNVPDEVRIPLINSVLKKASLKAMSLEDELNLPLHLPLPTFKKSE